MRTYKWIVSGPRVYGNKEFTILGNAMEYAMLSGGATVVQNHRDTVRLPWQYDWTAEVSVKKGSPVVEGW